MLIELKISLHGGNSVKYHQTDTKFYSTITVLQKYFTVLLYHEIITLELL